MNLPSYASSTSARILKSLNIICRPYSIKLITKGRRNPLETKSFAPPDRATLHSCTGKYNIFTHNTYDGGAEALSPIHNHWSACCTNSLEKGASRVKLVLQSSDLLFASIPLMSPR
jgi:hypothetical protein